MTGNRSNRKKKRVKGTVDRITGGVVVVLIVSFRQKCLN
jgi:hypothetical protein